MITANQLKIITVCIVTGSYMFLTLCLKAESNDLSEQAIEKHLRLENKNKKQLEELINKNIDKTKSDNSPVYISIDGVGRDNPFVPYGHKLNKNTGVPADVPYEIIEPPKFDIKAENQIKNMMECKISGILYDPSGRSTAIINIKEHDYMMREGDSIYGIVVEYISKDEVTLKYQNNRYYAAAGESIEAGDVDYDEVERSSPQFGGAGVKLPSISEGNL